MRRVSDLVPSLLPGEKVSAELTDVGKESESITRPTPAPTGHPLPRERAREGAVDVGQSAHRIVGATIGRPRTMGM